ncbi:tyrosine protein kinase [Yeosuana aromativorans]|uniref:non-specific protein-tyrosine kinase n=1 Tax=Yeosuana aromativorans TaxID=288019 RepID=A0A8J3FHL1_9FLAO|nr:tyrosine-protein kinase family protein [Yeosuana aromativorans]GGK29109.1 tyrosine protein kinase [Yeosuana aromativorans]
MISDNNTNMLDVQQSNEPFNLKKTISLYTKKWAWFLLCIALFLGLAHLYLRYQIPKYEAVANIMLISDTDASDPSAVFKDISLFSEKEDAQVEDEILVLSSRGVINEVADKLDLNIRYFTQGRVIETELYKNIPIAINFIASDSIINNTRFNFFIDINSDLGFNYRINEEDTPKKVVFGETIPTPFGGMVITPKSESKASLIGSNIRVQLTPLQDVTERLRNSIGIYQSGKSSKVISINLVDAVPERAKDIINTLISEYDAYTSYVKNIRSKNTAEFIDKRIDLIASDLVNVDDSIVRFKTGNKITDVSSEAGQFLSSNAQNQQVLDESKTQLRVLNYMEESLGDDNASFEPIPANLGSGDPAISALASRYSELLANRERLLRSAGEKNLVVVELDQSLNSIRQSLRQNIENSKKGLQIRIASLENQSDRINSKIYSVPGQERKLRSIERKQGIKESLYLYLLQKREEAAITLTSTSPNLKIIDSAYGYDSPVSPNKRMIYIGAFFLALFLPFSVIYVKDLLDTKIHNKEDLEQVITNMTILGEIPKIKSKHTPLVQRNDRSLLSESFRIIRTNFDYVRRGRHVKDYDNVIFVTSTINGEGKSFFSMNLALTFANTDKRVLLIGADIRNPKIDLEPLKKKKDKIAKIGLTEYLADDSVLVGEAINSYEVGKNHIDVMLSGKVPPNPAELLMSDRMKPLFDKVSEQYDYVIVDTAPAMLVTDTLLFSHFAGHTVYMTRAEYTEKPILKFAKELHANNKLKGMMLVVNDVDQANFGYGAKYGYYGAPKRKSFFKRFSRH